MTVCFFHGCENPVGSDAWRCDFHRGRDRCAVPNCRSQAYARKLCARHGGKRQCQFEGCSLRVRVGIYCARHGAKRPKAICSVEGCMRPAHLHRRCVRHGGGRYCKVPECNTYARKGGYCCRHNRLLHGVGVEGLDYSNSKTMLETMQPPSYGYDEFEPCCFTFKSDPVDLTDMWLANADILDLIINM